MIHRLSEPLSRRSGNLIALVLLLGALSILLLGASCSAVRVDPDRVTAVSDDWTLDVTTAPSGTLEHVYIKGPAGAKFGEDYNVRTGFIGGRPWISIYRNETQY